MTESNEPTCCEACGSLVIRHHSDRGPSYYIPINEEKVMALLSKNENIDMFTLDRLERADRIIAKLRKELLEAKNGKH